MKLQVEKDATSKIIHIFILDSTSSAGAGLTGLAWNSAGLTAYYIRPSAASATAITLATATVGTWTSGGFKEIDATNMPGWYEFDPPNACFATGVDSVSIHLKGATNMVALPIEIQLVTTITKLEFIEKWINNKFEENPTGTFKLYDNDDATVLKTWLYVNKERSKAT